ncbi:GntR family transcriptional regulator [Nonomuraea sp. NPDC004702]
MFVRRFKRYDRHGSKRHLHSQQAADTFPTQAETQAQGIQRELELVDVATVPAPGDVAAILGVDEGMPLVCRRHLITLDGDPAQTADSYFVAEQVDGSRIGRHERILGGVHSELAAVLGVPLTAADEVLIARMPTPAEKEVLSLLPGTPVVELTRTIYTDERPVEVTRFLFDAGWHRFIYTVPMD